jgi:hypothetical protein
MSIDYKAALAGVSGRDGTIATGNQTPLVSTGGASTYIKFVHPMIKDYEAIQQAYPGTTSADTVVVFDAEDPKDKYLVLPKPFKFWVTPYYHQFIAKSDSDGNLIAAEPPRRLARFGVDAAFKETIDAVIIVFADGNFYPARCRFKGPKASGFKTCLQATMELPEDKYITLTHTGRQGEPIQPKAKPNAKPGDPKPQPYRLFDTTTEGTTKPDLKLLTELAKDNEFIAELIEVATGWATERGEIIQLYPK